MSHFTAVIDSCVLHRYILRDLFVALGTTGLFRARWTEDIHNEWIKSVCLKNPHIPPEKLQITKTLMNEAVLDSVVENYEMLIPALALPDENDRHVLAAAIKSGADVIVTLNKKDFPPERLDPLGIEIQDPDTFLHHLLNLHPGPVLGVIKAQRAQFGNPPYGVNEYLTHLENNELPLSALFLRDFGDVI